MVIVTHRPVPRVALRLVVKPTMTRQTERMNDAAASSRPIQRVGLVLDLLEVRRLLTQDDVLLSAQIGQRVGSNVDRFTSPRSRLQSTHLPVTPSYPSR